MAVDAARGGLLAVAHFFDTASLSVRIDGRTIHTGPLAALSVDRDPSPPTGKRSPRDRYEFTAKLQGGSRALFDAFAPLAAPQSVDIQARLGDRQGPPCRVLFEDDAGADLLFVVASGVEMRGYFVEGPRMADGRWSPGEVRA